MNVIYRAGTNPAQDQYVQALTAAYRHGFRLYDPDLASASDPEIFDKIRQDPVVMAAIETRLHKVAGRRWRVEANRPGNEQDKQAAGIMDDLWRQCQRFSESRYELASAVLFNRSFAFIQGRRAQDQLGEDTQARDWWQPHRLQDVDRRRFRQVPEWLDSEQGRKQLRTYTEMWSVRQGRWLRMAHPEWFVKHVYGDEEARLGYGRGLLEAIYTYLWAKEVVIQEGLQGLERFAQGFLLVKVDGARDGSTGRANDAIQASWREVIKKARARHGIVADKLDDVEMIHPSGEGTKQVEFFLRYLDDAITRLITGSVLPTGGGGDGGSYARAEVEQDESEILVQYDRNLLDETLTRDAMGLVWNLNRPQLVAAGLADAKMPRFSTVQEPKVDPLDAVQIIGQALTNRIPLTQEEVYEVLGFSQPQEGDPVFDGADLAAAGFGLDQAGLAFAAQLRKMEKRLADTDRHLRAVLEGAA